MRLRACEAAILLFLLAPQALFAQDLEHIQVEKIASGLHFAEGPAWSRDGFLVLSDVPTDRVMRLDPPLTEKASGRLSPLRQDAAGPIGNALDAQGRIYTCESHTRRVIRMDKRGKIDVLAERWNGHRLNSPNDLAIRHDGHVYFTDPAFGSARATRELDFYGVFHITPKGELQLVAKWSTRPKGIALSPDGKLLYVSDADLHTIRCFDLDRTGAAANERLFVSGIAGVPLGLRTDENGNVYVAAKNGVELFAATGQHLGLIPTAETPSSCAFGDADFQTLYITARTSVYRTRLDVKGTAAH